MAKVTKMTAEDGLMHAEMVDEDNMMGFEGRFRAEACMYDGCSGKKPIDTMYENTSVDRVENPRSKTTPAPEDVIPGMYPHRRM
jgi:hypothetical protein